MAHTRVVEYVFFFGILGVTGYFMWQIIEPFFTALAIAAVVVTVSYPVFRKVLRYTPRQNRSIAAIVTTLLITLLVLTPLGFLGYLLFTETLSLYVSLSQGKGLGIDTSVARIEELVRTVAPSFSVDVTSYAQQAAGWVASHIGTIFAGTASTLLTLFLSIIGFFYFFRDGERFVRYVVYLSPLSDDQDTLILAKLASSVRSVILGTLAVALIQGTLTAIGLTVFGFEQPILWGAVAAVGALIPGVGTSIVFIPAVAYLVFEGTFGMAAGLAVWATLAVGLIDNLLGPYLMGRKAALHPFLILLAVLGGLALFGPIGFILGPAILSLFLVLLELYSQHMIARRASGD